MISLPFLKLMLDILPKMRSNPSDLKVNVISVGISSDENYHGLIKSIIETETGLFHRIDKDITFFKGDIDQDLKRHLEAKFWIDHSDNTQNIKIDIIQNKENNQVRINNKVPVSKGGHQSLASIINTLFQISSDSKDYVTLACIIYKDGTLDKENSSKLWSFLTQDLPNIGLGNIKNLIVIIESEYHSIDYYTSRPSLGYLLDGDDLKRRRSYRENDISIREISRYGSSNFLVLFLGAGMSVSSGLPLGNHLRDAALREFLNATPDKNSTQLTKEFYDFLHRIGNRFITTSEENIEEEQFCMDLTLERVMREELFYAGGREQSYTLDYFESLNENSLKIRGPSVRLLQNIITSLDKKLIVLTVNFDTLLETDIEGHVKVFSNDTEFEEAISYIPEYLTNGGPVPYIKLHGTIQNKNSILADIERTMSGLSPNTTKLLDTILNYPQKIPWVYVGCSMRDKDLNTYFVASKFIEKVDEYWVGINIEKTIKDFIENTPRLLNWKDSRQKDLENRFITETADSFFEILSSLWFPKN